MSRSAPEVITPKVANPSQGNLEWNAQRGEWKVWDGINKVQSFVNKPFKFAKLDERSSSEGWSEELGSISSSEFKYATDPIKVYSYKGGNANLLKEGTYADLKEELKADGLNYYKIVYVMLLDDVADIPIGSVVKLKIKGKTCNRWIEQRYTEDANLQWGGETETIGRFYYPVFKDIEILEPEAEEAKNCDAVLQEYFNGKTEKPQEVTAESEYKDDIPF